MRGARTRSGWRGFLPRWRGRGRRGVFPQRAPQNEAGGDSHPAEMRDAFLSMPRENSHFSHRDSHGLRTALSNHNLDPETLTSMKKLHSTYCVLAALSVSSVLAQAPAAKPAAPVTPAAVPAPIEPPIQVPAGQQVIPPAVGGVGATDPTLPGGKRF